MATLESQYWKFLEENPGSALTFEQWKVEFSKQLGESLMRYKDKEIEKLENQLEDFEMVRYRMNTEGFHYCFKHYSSFIDVDDDEFHRLRNKYLEVSEDLEQYVLKKIESLNDRILATDVDTEVEIKTSTFDLYLKYKDEFAGYDDVPSYDWFLHELRFNDKFREKYGKNNS